MGRFPAPLFVPLVTTQLGLRAAADACREGAPVRPAVSIEVATSTAAAADLRRLGRHGHGVLLRNASRMAPPPAVWRTAALHLLRTDIDVSCVLDVDSPGLHAIRSAIAGLGARIALRLTADHFLERSGEAAAGVAAAVASVEGAENIDVVIETGDVDPVPAAESIALSGMVARLPHAGKWRSITVLAADRATPRPDVPREHFCASTAWDALRAVAHPAQARHPSPLCFGTEVMPYWSERSFPYAVTGGYWFFARTAGPLELACAVVTHPRYCGPGFSQGDEWLQATATRRVTDADEDQLRWAAMNHHIALWTNALASPDHMVLVSPAAC